jgi:hypothetical protein
MPQVGFEPAIPVYEWAKTVHALHREATVIGASTFSNSKIPRVYICLYVFDMILSIYKNWFPKRN